MRPLDRVEMEARYLQAAASRNAFSIVLRVSSAGAVFSVRDPDSGQELYVSGVTESKTTNQFYDAVNSAIATAHLARELGVSFT